MATVCAGSLALMDAGVQLTKPVTGIAMGLITDETGKYAVLSDILGDEDHLGDMDFKVCGTKDGITACQMDLKINGLSEQMLKDALEQSKRGRLHILGEILKTLDKPRADYKPHAPRIEVMEIAKEFIGAVIGPGGKVIQDIQKTTGAIIHIEEVGNIGRIEIAADNKESMSAAIARIKGIVSVPEIGEVYEGKVKTIMPFGAFVEFLPGKDGLLHISEISWKRLETMDGVFKEGDLVKVKLLDVDKQGKVKLSSKALLPRPENNN
jgi:polyribonucleotide nucleotidyltransferase